MAKPSVNPPADKPVFTLATLKLSTTFFLMCPLLPVHQSDHSGLFSLLGLGAAERDTQGCSHKAEQHLLDETWAVRKKLSKNWKQDVRPQTGSAEVPSYIQRQSPFML